MKSNEILASTSDLVPTGFDPQFSDVGEVDWQVAMKRAIRSSNELLRRLGLQQTQDSDSISNFPTFVPMEFLRRIEPGNPHDPLLLQVLASPAEQQNVSDTYCDPVGDLDAVVAPGLLHKYKDRALVVSTGACGIHCRYCFRRDFPYSDASLSKATWRTAMSYVRENQIEEVILSGGDPLTLVDATLERLLDGIESIDHVRRLRIHSRMPIAIPQRITERLVCRLSQSRLAVWMVIHANHVNELDEFVVEATDRMIDAGIPVLNQAVLLRNVNDDANALYQLCLKLVNHRVQPYYLHQLDRAVGTTHFEVPVSRGLQLVDELRTRLPGYAVPTYVCEQAGKASKTVLTTRAD